MFEANVQHNLQIKEGWLTPINSQFNTIPDGKEHKIAKQLFYSNAML